MSKPKQYFDLEGRILRDCLIKGATGFWYVRAVLRWLDEHRDQLPGRTITESELREAIEQVRGLSLGDRYQELLAQFGVTVAPDPKPTNTERLAELIREIGYDIRHNGRLSGSNALALDLNARGVTAPGGETDE